MPLPNHHLVRAFLRGEPDLLITFSGGLIYIGLLVGLLTAQFHLPGVLFATFTVGLGAAGGSLKCYRTERGLWMLSGLFLVITSTLYGLILVAQVGDLVRGAGGMPAGMLIDFTVGTVLLAVNIRFLAHVTRHNWQLSRGRDV